MPPNRSGNCFVVGHLRCWVGKPVKRLFTRSLSRGNWREEVRIRTGSSLLPFRTVCGRGSNSYLQTNIRAWLKSCLPVAQPDDAFIDSILDRPAKERCRARSRHATDSAGKKRPMRDVKLASVALREAHQRIGRWIAIHLVSEMIGVEKNTTSNVQGHITNGSQLLGEKKRTIMAAMRGGGGIAFGASEASPSATFVQVITPKDVKRQHPIGQSQIVLIDPAVNSGISSMSSLSTSAKRIFALWLSRGRQSRFLQQPAEREFQRQSWVRHRKPTLQPMHSN